MACFPSPCFLLLRPSPLSPYLGCVAISEDSLLKAVVGRFFPGSQSKLHLQGTEHSYKSERPSSPACETPDVERAPRGIQTNVWFTESIGKPFGTDAPKCSLSPTTEVVQGPREGTRVPVSTGRLCERVSALEDGQWCWAPGQHPVQEECGGLTGVPSARPSPHIPVCGRRSPWAPSSSVLHLRVEAGTLRGAAAALSLLPC